MSFTEKQRKLQIPVLRFIEISFAQGLVWGYNNLEAVCLLWIMIRIQKEVCRVEHRDSKCGESGR
jgi:hypothetical protein